MLLGKEVLEKCCKSRKKTREISPSFSFLPHPFSVFLKRTSIPSFFFKQMGAKPIKSELGGMERSESSDSDEGGPSVLIEEDKTYLSPRERTKRLTVNDFELLNVVGKGSFGKVLQVKKKDTGKIFAMKVLQKDVVIARNQLGHTMTERYILETIRHPFLISLRYAFQSAGKLYLVMDYAAGGELFFHLKKEQVFSEARAGFYGAEIILALKHLHDHGILYRDLKPENVLLGRDGK
eukprot:TRINITY_DN83_c0_g2_i1.p1 TRINITY_DN83_c0_g2~~TRINITY_DN83_c0_g2_i1.p1  ORF type:complete len:236 (-),score=63.20 TRINITY_DN83_c0_g2_i1:968-1675(-)